MQNPAARLSRWVLAPMALAVCLSGCESGGGNRYEEPPPPKVYVSTALQHDVTDYVEETGTTEAFEIVEIRARVEGYLEEVNFEPGQKDITPDYELYRIDPKPYQATVNKAQAALKVAEARAKDAIAKYERSKKLAPQGAVSQEELVERAAAAEVAKAEIASAQAELESAELDLSYTIVKSPIAGRVGKTLVDKGNLVGTAMTTHLTTLINYDPIYASFNITERMLLDLRSKNGADQSSHTSDERKDVKILMGLENEEGYPHVGHLNYADLAVDSSSGTFQIRGVFPNPNFAIVPGLFVRIRIPIGTRNDALLVPESATGADQEGRYVLVVADEEGNKVVSRRAVTLGAKVGGMRVVLSGLEPTDKFVVRGIQRVRPGSKVEPVEETLTLPPELSQSADAADSAENRSQQDSNSETVEAGQNEPAGSP